MNDRDGRYGINMKKYCREHEAFMRAALDSVHNDHTDPANADHDATVKAANALAVNPSRLLDYHLEKLKWIQHERLIHLIVTVMVVFVELFVVSLSVLHPELGLLPPVIMLVLAVLLGFYFYHYFFLENTVQRWYKIADELLHFL